MQIAGVLGRLAQEIRVGRPRVRVFLRLFKVQMFGQMARFHPLWNMGASCTCKMQLQGKLQQFWASCASPPPLKRLSFFSAMGHI